MKYEFELPVHIQSNTNASQLPALLSELQHKLNRLFSEGQSDFIDLRSLPLFPGELQRLKQRLGEGEVHVTLDAIGRSDIYETAIAGVWWVTHFNQVDDVVAQHIEITLLPEIIKTSQDELQSGLEKLQQLLSAENEFIRD